MKKTILSILVALLFSISGHSQNVQKQVKDLDSYIQEAIKLWTPPGLVVAVVKDGEIVFTKGYGTRTIGENRPVDTNTLFMIGSTTKAFTSAAQIVSEGLIDDLIN